MKKAFTLIELLVALALMSIIVTALMLSYQASINLYSTMDKIRASDIQERTTISLMIDDFRSAFRNHSFVARPFNPIIQKNVLIEFTSSLSLDSSESSSMAIYRVSYQLNKNEHDDLYSLIRTERPYPNVPSSFVDYPTVLMDNVSGISLEYLDINANSRLDWNSMVIPDNPSLPRAIKMTLKTRVDNKSKESQINFMLNKQG